MNSYCTDLKLRDPKIVMNPERLGNMHQSRISFVRVLIRKMTNQKWKVKKTSWEFCSRGFGYAIYTLNTPTNVYNLFISSDEISSSERNDRVIAEKWDVTFALVSGNIDSKLLDNLRSNIPLQEIGRNSNKVLVLSRANKSMRVFEHILNCLSIGKQPNSEELARVGYILRTTAVYGNGKFGIADFSLLKNNPDFSQSFSAQMCAVYILREFSLDFLDYLAIQKGGKKAVSLSRSFRRYLGVGNATGLGMAPYLIRHPCVVDQWMTSREMALSTIFNKEIDTLKLPFFKSLIQRAIEYFSQSFTIDEVQKKINLITTNELKDFYNHFELFCQESSNWEYFIKKIDKMHFSAQEVVLVCLMELYPDLVDKFENHMNTDETLELPVGKKVEDMLEVLENRYAWAISEDFSNPDNSYWFWYSSQDKEEPRLGIRQEDEGSDKELPLDIGRQAHNFYNALKQSPIKLSLVEFLIKNPAYRTIARRVWTLSNKRMGEIQMNVLSKCSLPIHLLRCKLAAFGATKFDPRSDRWVRITLFQGAPLLDELHENEWLFPLIPS
ncbi:MAG: hypothetical protein IR526_04095 [Bordetella sp.]|nr:MAG: hypothetical protein IR526_04095 [Bordetella sp.]